MIQENDDTPLTLTQFSFPEQLHQFLETHKEDISQNLKDFILEGTSGNAVIKNTWGFTEGLLLGQLSVIIVLIVFVKFFVFADNTTIPSISSLREISGIIVKRDKNSIAKLAEEKDGSMADDYEKESQTILEKTYYDVNNHASESLDWFNVLVAQTIAQLRREALLSDNIYHSLNEALTKMDLPDYIDKINLTEIDIGDDFPIFSNCRVQHSKDGTGRLEAKIDVDLSDVLTLGIDTKLLLNHPRPLTAVLPVELSVSIVRFSGCLTVSLVNSNDQEFINIDSLSSPVPSSQQRDSHLQSHSKDTDSGQDNDYLGDRSSNVHETMGTALMFSFSPDYRLEFVVKSLIGSKAKLQNVPKISALVESKLRSWFVERCIEPRYQVVKLPSLWPRSKNTREPVHSNLNSLEKTEDSFM